MRCWDKHAGAGQTGNGPVASRNGSHPHVVLSEPFGNQRQILIVNWTTLDDECIDDACVLNADDHPAIKHTSTMAYSFAHLWREERILFAVANGSLVELPSVAQPVLKPIIDGAKHSPELRPEWKSVLARF